MRRVSVIGDGDVPPGDARLAVAEAVGRGIVDAGWVLVTGGRGGVMAAACRGGRSAAGWAPGRVVGVLPGTDAADANPWVDTVLPTGLGLARNVIVAQSEAVVAVGGRAGTLSEIALAWQLGRHVVALRGGGWAGRLADRPVDDRDRGRGPDDRVWGADDAEEVLRLLHRAFDGGAAGR